MSNAELKIYIKTVVDSLNESWSEQDKKTGFCEGYLKALNDVLEKIK